MSEWITIGKKNKRIPTNKAQINSPVKHDSSTTPPICGTNNTMKTNEEEEEKLKIWKKEQFELKKRLILKDDIDWQIKDETSMKTTTTPTITTTITPIPTTLKTTTSGITETTGKNDHHLKYHEKVVLKRIGGIDISFSKKNNHGDGQDAVVSLIILRFPDMKILFETYQKVKMTEPYIPGFLAFREVKAMCQIVKYVQEKYPHMSPQVILVDGNGTLHFRNFGLACHLGVITQIPTIGVAKQLLCVKGIVKDDVMEMIGNELSSSNIQIGSHIYLRSPQSNQILAAIMKTTNQQQQQQQQQHSQQHQQQQKQQYQQQQQYHHHYEGNSTHEFEHGLVYISQGHRLSLNTCIQIVKACCKGNVLPEPTFQADALSRKFIKEQVDNKRNKSKW